MTIQVKLKRKVAPKPRIRVGDQYEMGREPEYVNVDGLDINKIDVYWFRYYHDNKEAKNWLLTYIKANYKDKDLISRTQKINPSYISFSACVLAKLAMAGTILGEKHENFILQHIHEAKLNKDDVTDSEVVIKKIKERDSSSIIADLDDMIDIVNDINENDIQTYLLKYDKTPKAEWSIVKNYYQRIKDELALISSEPQVKEAYSIYKKTEIKHYSNILDKIITIANSKISVSSVSGKVRKPRMVNPIKRVSKLKYLSKTDTLTSIRPEKIIGSVCLLVFNTKNKMCSVYFASAGQKLDVRGTSIYNYDEDKSFSYTIRKPELFIPKLLDSNKSALINLFETLTTQKKTVVSTINSYAILLKVF